MPEIPRPGTWCFSISVPSESLAVVKKTVFEPTKTRSPTTTGELLTWPRVASFQTPLPRLGRWRELFVLAADQHQLVGQRGDECYGWSRCSSAYRQTISFLRQTRQMTSLSCVPTNNRSPLTAGERNQETFQLHVGFLFTGLTMLMTRIVLIAAVTNVCLPDTAGEPFRDTPRFDTARASRRRSL